MDLCLGQPHHESAGRSTGQHVGIGTGIDGGAEVLVAVAFVLNDDEWTCGPPLVPFPGGDERAADVQPAVDDPAAR